MDKKKPSKDASNATAANGAVHDFFSQAQQMWAPMTETMQEQRALMERGLEDFAKAQAAGLRRTRETADEMAEVMKASMNYTTELTHEWMNMGLTAARRTMSAFAAAGR
jgi:broad specificity phosphatase PhoE